MTRHARSMRKRSTPAEARLWRRLRGKRLGVRFRRQHPVAGYIADFYCAQARLVVELDGGGHSSDEQRESDARRDRALRRRGLRVVRVWNPEVISNLDGVLERIWSCIDEQVAASCAPLARPHPNPPPQAGEGFREPST